MSCVCSSVLVVWLYVGGSCACNVLVVWWLFVWCCLFGGSLGGSLVVD